MVPRWRHGSNQDPSDARPKAEQVGPFVGRQEIEQEHGQNPQLPFAQQPASVCLKASRPPSLQPLQH